MSKQVDLSYIPPEKKKHPLYYVFVSDDANPKRGGFNDLHGRYKNFNVARARADTELRNRNTVQLVQVVHITTGRIEYEKSRTKDKG